MQRGSMEQLVVSHPVDIGLLQVEVLKHTALHTGLGLQLRHTNERVDLLNGPKGLLLVQTSVDN